MEHFSVIIVGAGISGLSSAYHLQKLGIQNIAICDDQLTKGMTSASPGFVSGGFFDNFTRLSHVHGTEKAKTFWNYGNHSFAALEKYCVANKILFAKNRRIRIITSDEEMIECRQATEQMKKEGLTQTFQSIDHSQKKFDIFEKNSIGLQIEENIAAHIDTAQLIKSLENKVKKESKFIFAKVSSTNSDESRIEISLENGTKLSSEMLIFANHLEISNFIPSMKNCLIPVADQWLRLTPSKKEIENFRKHAGICYSANHGYEWGVIEKNGTICQGGSRYLLKNAGIGLENHRYDEKIESNIWLKSEEMFGEKFTYSKGEMNIGLECRPCDELPIIGPMFGENRILMATGYMGQGLGFGFLAGRCLATLIKKGVCDELPRNFWPERLRSLEQ